MVAIWEVIFVFVFVFFECGFGSLLFHLCSMEICIWFWFVSFFAYCWSKEALWYGKGQNFESLSEFWGVKELALILETNVKKGINSCEADLIQRQTVFSANKFQKPPPKRFLRFMFDAFKDTAISILLACVVLSLGFGIK